MTAPTALQPRPTRSGRVDVRCADQNLGVLLLTSSPFDIHRIFSRFLSILNERNGVNRAPLFEILDRALCAEFERSIAFDRLTNFRPRGQGRSFNAN